MPPLYFSMHVLLSTFSYPIHFLPPSLPLFHPSALLPLPSPHSSSISPILLYSLLTYLPSLLFLLHQSLISSSLWRQYRQREWGRGRKRGQNGGRNQTHITKNRIMGTLQQYTGRSRQLSLCSISCCFYALSRNRGV